MKDFVEAIKDAAHQENWLAALSLSLLMPDICGRIDDPLKKSRHRYASWFDTWFQHSQSRHKLAGNDCYALRCAIAHEGRDSTSTQDAKVAIEKFHFAKPSTDKNMLHVTEITGVLYYPVDIFADEMCKSVNLWLASKSGDLEAQDRLGELIKIHDATANVVAGDITFPSFGSL